MGQVRGADGGPAIAAQALVYPAVDFTTVRPSQVANGEGYLLTAAAMQWFAAQYLGHHDPADPEASPLLAADLSGLPPAVVATAEFDPLRDEGAAYADRLKNSGVLTEYVPGPGLIHGYAAFLGVVDAADATATEAMETFARLLRS